MKQTQHWPSRTLIRQAQGGDRDAIGDFLNGLSPRTRYLRFFTGVSPSGGSMLHVLAGGRACTDVLVATENGAVIGHAMAADAAGPDGSRWTEVAVVVTDAWQGRGVGSALVRVLAARARARGAVTMVMDVLAENRHVLTMIDDHWPDASHEHAAARVTVRADLPAHEEGHPCAGLFPAGVAVRGGRPVPNYPGAWRRARKRQAAHLPLGGSRDRRGRSA